MEEQTAMQNKSDTPKKKRKHKGLMIAGSAYRYNQCEQRCGTEL